MNPVLFLDFDGVLHSEPSLPKEAFSQLPLVEAILRDFPSVEIVVSSTWRLDWMGSADSVAVTHLRRHFSKDIALRVVGVTPFLGRIQESGLDARPYTRKLECCAWLKSNRSVRTPWLALDDRAEWFLPGCPNLMKVGGGDGFMPSDEDLFRQHLTRITTARPHPGKTE